jgi:hypothetical protein
MPFVGTPIASGFHPNIFLTGRRCGLPQSRVLLASVGQSLAESFYGTGVQGSIGVKLPHWILLSHIGGPPKTPVRLHGSLIDFTPLNAITTNPSPIVRPMNFNALIMDSLRRQSGILVKRELDHATPIIRSCRSGR